MTTEVVTVSLERLRMEVCDAVAKAMAEERQKRAAGIERVSAVEAARILRRRKGFLLEACAKGWLPAVRDGKGWKIAADDLDRWAKAGCPGTVWGKP